MYWNHGFGGMSGWAAVSMTITMILFWLLILAAIVALLRSGAARWGASQEQRRKNAPNTAEQELAARFARGEIDEEEYRRRLDVLRSTGGSGPGS